MPEGTRSTDAGIAVLSRPWGRALGALSVGALPLAMLDSILASIRFGGGVVEWIAFTCLACSIGILAVPLVGALAAMGAGLDRRAPRPGLRWIAGGALVLCAAWFLWATPEPVPGLPHAVLWLVAVVLTVPFILSLHRSRRPWTRLMAYFVMWSLFLWFSESLDLPRRVHPARPGLALVLLATGLPGFSCLGLLAERLLLGLAGERPPWTIRVLGAMGGFAVAFAALVPLPGQYLDARPPLFILSVVLTGTAAVSLGLRGPRWILAVLGIVIPAASALLFLVGPPALSSGLTRSSSLATCMLGRLRQEVGGLRSFRRKVETRAAAGECRSLETAARAWNARAGGLLRPRGVRSILLVTMDAFRYDHAGYQAAPGPVATPGFDRLSARSIRFHGCRVQGGITFIALPSLIRSRYPGHLIFENKVECSDGTVRTRGTLPDSVVVVAPRPVSNKDLSPTLFEVLRDHGFQTMAVLNDYDLPGFFGHQGPEIARGASRLTYLRTEALGDPMARGEVGDDIAVRVASEQLAEAGDRPFFLWVHLFETHLHIDNRTATEYAAEYQRRVSAMDHNVAALMDALEATGRDADTLVVVTGDHGEGMGEHGFFFHGTNLHEPAVRVPLLMRVPGLAGRDVHDSVGSMDVAPTILNILGIAVPDSMEGFSLLPSILGSEGFRRPPVFMETFQPATVDERLLLHLAGVTDGRRKVIWDVRLDTLQFFDLAVDPGEDRDLFSDADDAEVEDFLDLTACLLAWHADCRAEDDVRGTR